ncbi:A-kinase anchor protein 17A-like [Centruroides sculpturatus]|uniref:A-kinase anchor protein 17A-like n=2 Tax=Centruroides sculpturatus TaxID=218467 RepID=UPI000C6E12C4|nr:A-kinase anchor protein 17A-like [Centruroides sculpturatus]
MSLIQPCKDTSEAVELCTQYGLYLKPIAKLNICVQLPALKTPGKSISNWEVMEKVKKMIKPEEFIVLKVTKTSLEFIRFEGELENKSVLKTVISRLDGNTMKLSGFSDVLKIRAAEAKIAFPTRHDWDSYFRDAKNMNEMKPGERPDTIFFSGLPSKWFSDKKQDNNKPNEHILKKVFSVFGEIRHTDIPMLDPYYKDMNKTVGVIQTFSFSQDLTFEAYVQFNEYMGFVKAMDALRGMKLMYQSQDGKAHCANIKIDFDKTKHLSDKNIKKRRSEREKLLALEKEREERVKKEREEEEKRRKEERKKQEDNEQEREKKRIEKLRKREERRKRRQEKHSLKEKKRKEERRAYEICLEERRKLIAQRKLETIRLLTAIFERAKDMIEKEEMEKRERKLKEERLKQIQLEERKKELMQKQEEQQRQEKLKKQEQILRDALLRSMKAREEKQTEELREKLRRELAGKNVLKSVLVAVQPKMQPVVSSTNSKNEKEKLHR